MVLQTDIQQIIKVMDYCHHMFLQDIYCKKYSDFIVGTPCNNQSKFVLKGFRNLYYKFYFFVFRLLCMNTIININVT